MSKPNSLSEAISTLESASQNKGNEFKNFMEKDYQEVLKAIDKIKPYLDDLKNNTEKEITEAKNNVENKIKDHPWYAIGLVGLICFFIGWLIGFRKD